MPAHAVYEFTCLCGRNFQTEDPHDLECPDCGRALIIEWRAARVDDKTIGQPEEVRV